MYYLCYSEKDVQVHARPPLVADKIVINPANNHPFSRQNIHVFASFRSTSVQSTSLWVCEKVLCNKIYCSDQVPYV